MLAFLVVATVVSAIAAAVDFRTGHIPNWLTLGTFAAGPLAHAGLALRAHAEPSGVLSALGMALASAMVCAALPAVLWMGRAIGGGDVKLFFGIGAWLSPSVGFDVVFDSFAAFVVVSIVVLAWRGKLRAMLANVGRILKNLARPKGKRIAVEPASLSELRMGPAIFLGTLCVTLQAWHGGR